MTRLRAEVEQLGLDRKTAERQISIMRGDAAALRDKFAEAERSLAGWKQRAEASGAEAAALARERDDAAAKISDLGSRIEARAAEAEATARDRDDAREECSRLAAELQGLKDAHRASDAARDDARRALEALRRKEAQLSSCEEKTAHELEGARTRAEELKAELDASREHWERIARKEMSKHQSAQEQLENAERKAAAALAEKRRLRDEITNTTAKGMGQFARPRVCARSSRNCCCARAGESERRVERQRIRGGTRGTRASPHQNVGDHPPQGGGDKDTKSDSSQGVHGANCALGGAGGAAGVRMSSAAALRALYCFTRSVRGILHFYCVYYILSHFYKAVPRAGEQQQSNEASSAGRWCTTHRRCLPRSARGALRRSMALSAG